MGKQIYFQISNERSYQPNFESGTKSPEIMQCVSFL